MMINITEDCHRQGHIFADVREKAHCEHLLYAHTVKLNKCLQKMTPDGSFIVHSVLSIRISTSSCEELSKPSSQHVKKILDPV